MASSGYQMTDAIKMSGGILEVGHDGKDVVMHIHGGRQVRLTAEGRKAFRPVFDKTERRADGEDCGEAVPVGTVTDLTAQAPKTVWRDGSHLVIPAIRLDAEGCKLLRTIINGELPDMAVKHGPDCQCTPCKAEPSYRAHERVSDRD